jgi:pimeloyl-ACP methyl ester carboxylesterase
MQTPVLVPGPNGRALAVREGGDPGGVPVFVLHGTPGSGMLLTPALDDASARGIRLVGYDRPGYGGSTRHEGRSVADCAADIVAIADALGIDRFCLYGGSGGGPHALAAAALLPDRIAAAAALASPAPYGAEGLDYYAGMGEDNVTGDQALLAGEGPARELLAELREMTMTASAEDFMEGIASLISETDRAAITPEGAAEVLEQARIGVAYSLDGWLDDGMAFVCRPWGFDLGSIRVPLLYWHGEQDRFVPLAHGAWLVERIPGVEARLTPDDGHITLFERRLPDVHAWLLERV